MESEMCFVGPNSALWMERHLLPGYSDSCLFFLLECGILVHASILSRLKCPSSILYVLKDPQSLRMWWRRLLCLGMWRGNRLCLFLNVQNSCSSWNLETRRELSHCWPSPHTHLSFPACGRLEVSAAVAALPAPSSEASITSSFIPQPRATQHSD